MNRHTPHQALLCLLALAALGCASAAAAPAQEEMRRQERAVTRVQAAVRVRILAERGGRDEYVVFNNDAQRVQAGFNEVGVRGTGVYYRDGRGNRERREEFNYSGVYNTRSNNVERTDYRFDNRGDGNDRNVPNWLVGTFRGRNPSGRGRALVTVEEDGRVAVVHGDGTRESGRYRDRQLRVGNAVWNVSRNGDGFRAQDNSTRRAEDFARVQGGDDAGGGEVPDWAVGTFRGTTDSGESELTINRDGSVVARSLTQRTTFTGRYADGRLRFDWGTYSVVREGDGIRTINIGDRRNQTSYRRVGAGGGWESNDGRVPDWAVGTFRGPSDSGEVELTIHANGTATIMPLTGTRTLHSGRYADGVLTFDWGSFNLVREPNGLRTVNRNDRRNQTSYRRVN
jgi:hypothetical protein